MDRLNQKDIDLRNLFSKGAEVHWPNTKSNGFLSYKNCKSLWTLGGRTTMTSDESIKLIEDIITCINVYNYSKMNNCGYKHDSNNIYIKAYGELTTYLRYLLIFYNSMVSDDELKRVNIPFINYVKNAINKYDQIIIITYNYDIWLERLMKLNDILFNIEGFENNTDARVKIIKPHGSISFSFNVKITGPFTIRNSEFDDISQEINQFKVNYDLTDDYPIVNAIIPPTGDSNRCNMDWIKVLRERIRKKVSDSQEDDKLILFGISYWEVDRAEIDEIITMINPDIEVNLINPKPSTCFDAVLTSLFKNYIHYKSSDLLEAND